MRKYNLTVLVVLFVALFTSSGAFAGDMWLFTYPLSNYYEPRSCDFDCHTNDPEYPRPGGNDYACPEGTAVLAVEDGTVILIQDDGAVGYGLHVIFQHNYGYTTLYGHLSEVSVSYGQYVSQGQLLGESGHSGFVIGNPGDHLHLEVRDDGTPIDPYSTSHWLWCTYPPQLYSKLLYSGSYVGKSHSETISLQPGSSVNCWIDFQCNPPFYWTSDGNSSHYVALHSVANNWTDMENSQLISGNGNLLDDDGSTADPNGIARFHFTITAPQTPGTYTLRTRVYHPHSGSFITGTGTGTNETFTVNVVAPPAPKPCSDLVSVYASAPGKTKLHTFLSTGSRFNYQGYWWYGSSFTAPNLVKAASGDFNGDGYTDVAGFYDYPGSKTKIFVWLSNGSSFSCQSWWDMPSGYNTDNIEHMVAGDFNGDGRDDVAVMYDYPGSATRIHVWLSTGKSFSYRGSSGWWRSASYSSSSIVQLLPGYFNASGGSGKVFADDDGSSEETRGPLPKTFTLNQNYPNPFNPVTTISYTLPKAMHVELCVFNILGQKVETLINEHQAAGQHTISWAADQRASGIYFYRIRAGDVVETKKMVLLK